MLMQIDGTFIFVIISFLIFLFIIKSILYTPITKVLAERENFYNKNSKMELESKEKTKTLISDKEEKLKQSKLEATSLIKETGKIAKDLSEKKINEAKNEVKAQNDKKAQELTEENKNVKLEIKKDVSSFVSLIVSKVLNENVEINVDDTEINKYLKV